MINNIIKNKRFISGIFIMLTSIMISIPMFMQNFNIQYDDGIQHICRIIGTSQSINEGQLFPVIMSKLCNNFGYSWNLFYSPFTAYSPLVFKIFGLSYTMCLKIFMIVVSIATGYSMYFFMKKILKNKIDDSKLELISILASVLYILAPYRLNDMYIRLAIAELTSFIFIPIVFNGLYTIVNLKEKSILLILGSACMLLTHSMLTIYLVMFCIIYLIVNIKLLNKKTILKLICNIIIILLITSFYWVPLLESRLSANYEVFNQDHMIRWDVMKDLKPSILELFIKIDGRMFYGLGIITIIGSVLGIVKIKEIKEKKNYILFLILGLISAIMSINIFPFEKLPPFFTMMQFSFRMLEFSSFFLIVPASIATGINLEKFNIYTVIVLISISTLLILPGLKELNKEEYYKESDLIEGIAVTEKTKRVHAGCASFEYLPSKAFNNRKYIEDREDKVIVLNDRNCNILEYNKNGTNCNFKVENFESDNIQIELPYIYYIGYNVKYEDESGNINTAKTFESDNGFVEITLPKGNTKVTVNYTGTSLMKISYTISIITLLGILIIYTYNIKNFKIGIKYRFF